MAPVELLADGGSAPEEEARGDQRPAAGAGKAARCEEEDGGSADAVSWPEIRSRLRLGDGNLAAAEILRLFEARYGIASAAEALVQVKAFLGEYLVQEFDYKAFCLSLGKVTAKTLEEDGAWSAHVAKHLSADLGAAAAVMLRVAATIAKAFGLQLGDWKDVNDACGNAIRAVPACYHLQRTLPGALNDARALRYLPVATTDAGRDLNPWKSHEGRQLFEDAHSVPWESIEALTAQDKRPLACFAGTFEVEEVTAVEDLTCVYMRARRAGEPPGGYATKEVLPGDAILWEVDSKVGALLERGMVIEGDWYEMETEVCFMSSLLSVTPLWAAGTRPDEFEDDEALQRQLEREAAAEPGGGCLGPGAVDLEIEEVEADAHPAAAAAAASAGGEEPELLQ